MSRHLLIDGYNLTHKIPQLSAPTLEASRAALVRFIETHRPQGSARNDVTVVFDGSEDVCGSSLHGQTRVLFSKGESADDLIKRLVTDAPRPADMVVVTDDRALAQYVGALGAQVWSVDLFVVQAKKKGASGRAASSVGVDTKTISYTLATRINRELSDRWLGKPKDSPSSK
jgi:predicted RNA-binding protein with PIN domain